MCFVLSVQACSVFSVKSLGYGSNHEATGTDTSLDNASWSDVDGVTLYHDSALQYLPQLGYDSRREPDFPTSLDIWHGVSRNTLRAQREHHSKEARNGGNSPIRPLEHQSFSFAEVVLMIVEK